MNSTPVILDVDTGIDDAFAILFAARHPSINLLGVTCVDGNTNVAQVVANTLQVLLGLLIFQLLAVQYAHFLDNLNTLNMYMVKMEWVT